jgi:hypothetical protein
LLICAPDVDDSPTAQGTFFFHPQTLSFGLCACAMLRRICSTAVSTPQGYCVQIAPILLLATVRYSFL